MRWLFLLFALSLSSVFTHAKGGSLEERIRQTHRGKVLTLRQFYDGDKLRLDSRGQLTGEATTGPWTVDGQLQVTDIDLQSGTLHIKAKRLTLVFDPSTKKLRV
jgi:hypothetical protein